LEKLREKGIQIKNKAQIQLKRLQYGTTKISLGQLEQWCIDHNTIPDDEDKGFVAAYSVNYGDEDEELDENDSAHLLKIMDLSPIIWLSKKKKLSEKECNYLVFYNNVLILLKNGQNNMQTKTNIS
jgi:hypothetical protein